MKKVRCLIAFMRICIKSWYLICMESVYLMKCMSVCFKWYHYMCYMPCMQTSIFRGISKHNEWTTEVKLFNKCENLWYSSHILIINASFWKLEILIRSSLTVTSVGCFRMPSSSLKLTGPTHDTCLENALMGWVPWWTRPYRTAHALLLRRGKHAKCERLRDEPGRWVFCAPHYLEYYCSNGLVSVYRDISLCMWTAYSKCLWTVSR